MNKVLIRINKWIGITDTSEWNTMQLLFGKHYIGAIILLIVLFIIFY